MNTYLSLLALLSMVLTINTAHASDARLPFASEIQAEIKHYNRATPRLATSGTPGPGAVKELTTKGIRTFIDLRTPQEGTANMQAEAESIGAVYHNIPVYGSEGISKEQVQKFAAVYERADGLVLVNCGSGNRVGALLAAYLMYRGVDAKEAIFEGRTAGMRTALENDVKAKFCVKC